MLNKVHTILSLMVILGLSACGEPPKYGPWDGFVYVQESKNNFTLKSQGRYEFLDQCMRTLQVRTSKNGYPYYCGFECEENAGGEMDCEKILGYPELD